MGNVRGELSRWLTIARNPPSSVIEVGSFIAKMAVVFFRSGEMPL